MKSISKYVPSEGRLDVLESPYMEIKTSSAGNKAFDVMFRNFKILLATKDAEYGSKEERGASNDELNSIITEVENSLNKLISKIESEEEKVSFVDNMEKIRECGDFGFLLYDYCNIKDIADTIENEEKKKYANLVSRVQYLLITGNKLLNTANFIDFEILITDIAKLLDQLESYVKNPEYPIEEIRSLQAKLDNLSKTLRSKIKKESTVGLYEECIINTTNEDLRFECEKLCGLLLTHESGKPLDDLFTVIFQAITKIKNEEEFNSFKKYLNDIRNAGTIGKELCDSKLIDLDNLTYDKLKNIEPKSVEQPKKEGFDLNEMAQSVAQTIVAYEQNKTLDGVDSLLNLLYLNKEKVNIVYLKTKTEQIKEYADVLDNLINKYELEKQSMNKNAITK